MEEALKEEKVLMPGSLYGKENSINSLIEEDRITENLESKIVNGGIPKSNTLETPCYIIDITAIGPAADEAFIALSNLTKEVDNADTAVYLRKGEKIHLQGKGDGNQLYRLLEPLVLALFGDSCKIYVDNGSGMVKLKRTDVYNLKLAL